MKNKTLPAVLTNAVLCFALSFGGIGCLATAFDLTISFGVLARCCAITAVAGCFLFSSRKGSFVALGILAALAVYLWRRTPLTDQILHLSYLISRLFHGAYNCGWLGRPMGVDSIALPLYLWGSLTALIAALCLSTRRATTVAFAFSLAPLALCLVLTDTIPGTGYLITLLLGLILLLLTQGVRRQNSAQLSAFTWLLSIPVALALIALFLTNPQTGYNKQHYADRLGDSLRRAVDRIPYVDFAPEGHLQFNPLRHTPSSVDLASKGPNSQFSIPVMRVTAEADGILYLRGRDYDDYSGTQWNASEGRNEIFTAFQENTVNIHDISPVSMGKLTITTTGTYSARYLPYYPDLNYQLQSGTCSNPSGETTYSYNWYALPEDFETANGDQTFADYGIVSSSVAPSKIYVEDDGVFYYSIVQTATPYANYLELPEDTRVWAEAYLADHLPLLSDEANVGNRANAIAGLVRESAVYDLDTPRMPEDSLDFARWFLEESDTGYCVHYATATTVLLRAAGIPARYVEGYLTVTEADGTVTVTEKNAHAWAECYIFGLGWIPLESTAGGPDASIGATATSQPDDTTAGTTEPASEPSTEPSTANTDGTTEPSEPPVTSLPTDPSEGRPGQEDNPGQPMPGTEKDPAVTKTFLAVVAFLALLIIQYPIRLCLREKHLGAGDPGSRAVKLWRYTCRLAKLAHQAPPAHLEELALRARFSHHKLIEADLIPFRTYRQETIRQLRERPWWIQLYHRLIRAAY